jgi:GAF domain-containing protein
MRSPSGRQQVSESPVEAPLLRPLADPARLEALRETALLDSPAEGAFDRLTRLAARLLRAPVALVSLVDVDRQFFKSCVGLPGPFAEARETPLSHSFCQHAVERGQPLVIDDARMHPLVRENAALRDLDVIAYAGIPLRTVDGVVLGSFCVIDHVPRRWTVDDLATLRRSRRLGDDRDRAAHGPPAG